MLNGYELKKPEKKDYAHFSKIADSTVFAMVEDFFAPWHPDGAILEASFCKQFMSSLLPEAEMVPLFDEFSIDDYVIQL